MGYLKRKLSQYIDYLKKRYVLKTKDVPDAVDFRYSEEYDKLFINEGGFGKMLSRVTVVYTFVFTILFGGIYFVYVMWDLPDYKRIKNYQPYLTNRVYYDNMLLMAELGLEKRSFVNLEYIPQIVQDAFISAEDKNFFEHSGFDYQGIVRAVINNALRIFGVNKEMMGASTISQQVAKNFFLSRERTLKRKIREAILTQRIEKSFSKEHILEIYLNEIYLGKSSYGVSTAVYNYFNKSLDQVTVAEAAMLASLPKAPVYYNPSRYPERAKKRRDWVLDRMYKNGKITLAQKKKAQAEKIKANVNYKHDTNRDYNLYSIYTAKEELAKKIPKQLPKGGFLIKTTFNRDVQKYSYIALRRGIERMDIFSGWKGAYKKAEDYIPSKFLSSKEDKIKFLKLQKNKDSKQKWLEILQEEDMAEIAYQVEPWKTAIVLNVRGKEVELGFRDGEERTLTWENNPWKFNYVDLSEKKEEDRQSYHAFTDFLHVGDILFTSNNRKAVKQIPNVNGSVVVMDAHTGKIFALQGGFSFRLSQYNRATLAKRQPGSAFKPFIYLLALQKGYTPSTLVLDAPYAMDAGKDKGTWKPRNYKGIYKGYVTLRQGLEHSQNYVTLRVSDFVGFGRISRFAKKIGLYDERLRDMSSLLGSQETTLLKMTQAFSIFANGGYFISPYMIELVSNRDGKTIYKNIMKKCKTCNGIAWKKGLMPPIINTDYAKIADPVSIYQVTKILQGAIEHGTGMYGQISGHEVAGKTGTTNDSKDLWFVGYSPDIVVGVYIGADTPRNLTNKRSAGSIATPVFRELLNNTLKNSNLNYDAKPFHVPKGVKMVWVDKNSGKRTKPSSENAILEFFKENTEPQESDIIDDEDVENPNNIQDNKQFQFIN